MYFTCALAGGTGLQVFVLLIFEPMKTFVNWGNGREKDFGVLLPLIPRDIESLVIPFLGCGDILLNVEARKYEAGDDCEELVEMWRFVSKPQVLMLEILEGLMRDWKTLEGLMEVVMDRLVVVYDSYFVGAFDNHFSLVNTAGRVVDDVRIDGLNVLRGWREEELRMELLHQVVAALERAKTAGVGDVDRLKRRIMTAGKEAYFAYVAHLYNQFGTKPQARIGALIWMMTYAKGHAFVRDNTGAFYPDYAGTEGNGLTYGTRIETLRDDAFFARMGRTQFYKKDVMPMLQYLSLNWGDFIFVDPPRLAGKGKKKTKMYSPSTQFRLADYLLHRTKARWMVIVPVADPVLSVYQEHKVRQVEMNDEMVIWNY